MGDNEKNLEAIHYTIAGATSGVVARIIGQPLDVLKIRYQIQNQAKVGYIPAYIYLFKASNRNTRTMSEICSKFKIKMLERLQWRRYRVFIVNLEQISLIILVFLLLTLNK